LDQGVCTFLQSFLLGNISKKDYYLNSQWIHYSIHPHQENHLECLLLIFQFAFSLFLTVISLSFISEILDWFFSQYWKVIRCLLLNLKDKVFLEYFLSILLHVFAYNILNMIFWRRACDLHCRIAMVFKLFLHLRYCEIGRSLLCLKSKRDLSYCFWMSRSHSSLLCYSILSLQRYFCSILFLFLLINIATVHSHLMSG